MRLFAFFVGWPDIQHAFFPDLTFRNAQFHGRPVCVTKFSKFVSRIFLPQVRRHTLRNAYDIPVHIYAQKNAHCRYVSIKTGIRNQSAQETTKLLEIFFASNALANGISCFFGVFLDVNLFEWVVFRNLHCTLLDTNLAEAGEALARGQMSLNSIKNIQLSGGGVARAALNFNRHLQNRFSPGSIPGAGARTPAVCVMLNFYVSRMLDELLKI